MPFLNLVDPSAMMLFKGSPSPGGHLEVQGTGILYLGEVLERVIALSLALCASTDFFPELTASHGILELLETSIDEILSMVSSVGEEALMIALPTDKIKLTSSTGVLLSLVIPNTYSFYTQSSSNVCLRLTTSHDLSIGLVATEAPWHSL